MRALTSISPAADLAAAAFAAASLAAASLAAATKPAAAKPAAAEPAAAEPATAVPAAVTVASVASSALAASLSAPRCPPRRPYYRKVNYTADWGFLHRHHVVRPGRRARVTEARLSRGARARAPLLALRPCCFCAAALSFALPLLAPCRPWRRSSRGYGPFACARA